MKITLFGSCRQWSIANYFDVTSIQSDLTYPHYTKEIIQAIEYCKKDGISLESTQYCFRTGILNKRPIDNSEHIYNEFNETDVFIIEIASRITYKYGEQYVHHILTQNEYGFCDISSIVISELSDEEIEKDICRIKELLFPKKILIVSHVYTYEYGKRYELIKLLEKLCLKYELPFFSPSDYLRLEDNVYVDEKVLSHYTEKGISMVAPLYKNKISDLYLQRTVVLVIKQKYCNCIQTSTDNFWGIGDILRSILGMYKKSQEYKFELLVDISHHPISQFIQHSSHRYTKIVDTIVDTITYFVKSEIDHHINSCTDNVLYMGAHCELDTYNASEYDAVAKLFIKKHFQPTSEFMNVFTNRIGDIQLSRSNIIHYRLGDTELVKNISHPNMNKYYTHLLKHSTPSSILLTDSSTFKSYIKEQGCEITMFDYDIGHLGYDTSYDKIQNSLFEFFILTKVNHISSFSVYEWISGFAYSVHKIYGIPLYSAIQIDNI